MGKNQNYRKLLNKMFAMENIGETFYRSLMQKTDKENLKLIYEKLAVNERETAKRIAKEILIMDKNCHIPVNRTALVLVKIICRILAEKQLNSILKNILERKIYSKWYGVYRGRNHDFWHQLLEHENLQHELLGIL